METVSVSEVEFIQMLYPISIAIIIYIIGISVLNIKSLSIVVNKYCSDSYSEIGKAYFISANLDIAAGFPIQLSDEKGETITFRGGPIFDLKLIGLFTVSIVSTTLCFWVLIYSVVRVEYFSVAFMLLIFLLQIRFLSWILKSFSRIALTNYYATGNYLLSRKLSKIKQGQ